MSRIGRALACVTRIFREPTNHSAQKAETVEAKEDLAQARSKVGTITHELHEMRDELRKSSSGIFIEDLVRGVPYAPRKGHKVRHGSTR
jgi:hypothetical protein